VSVYGHLSGVDVHERVSISAGTVIGLSGNTLRRRIGGRSTRAAPRACGSGTTERRRHVDDGANVISFDVLMLAVIFHWRV
jgi:hypothetical protein